MIDQTTLITYLVVLIGFVFIPGPAVVLTLARATSSGTRVGLATGCGIAVGDLVHTAMTIIGLSALIMASALMFNLVKYLGAAYLLYLGIRALLERAPAHMDRGMVRITPRRAFREAVIAEILNPKSAMFFLAFLPQFVRPENGSVALQLAILGALFVGMGLVATVVFAVSAGALGSFLRRHPAVLRWQNKVVGCIYCALGIRLALQER